MLPFEPLFGDPHLQTVAGHFWPRPYDPVRFPLEDRIYRTAPDVQVLVKTQRPAGTPRGEMILVHGLEGSSESGYMRGMSHAALGAGFVTHRMNLRGCGGTESFCNTLYHSGLTADLRVIVEDLQAQGRGPVWLVGFSLGGNVVLKLAGELAEAARGSIAGVCSVSAPIDLAASAGRIHEPDNWIYERRFLRHMRTRLMATGRYQAADLEGIRSIIEMDDRVTAPSFGFRDAAHYYATQSSGRFLDRIRVPVLLIHAEDDTFIPFVMYRHAAFDTNPSLHLLATRRGGHLGFIARRGPRFWLDSTVIEWILEHSGTKRETLAYSH